MAESVEYALYDDILKVKSILCDIIVDDDIDLQELIDLGDEQKAVKTTIDYLQRLLEHEASDTINNRKMEKTL
jgi:hypothetical protein